MKRTLAALILTTALATPLVAQETPLSGTVAEIFGTQIVLTTPEGRLLVTLPEGATVPTPGTRLDLTGTRTGDTFAAATLTGGPAADPAEAMLPAALRGLGLTDIRSHPDDDGETYFYARSGTGWLRAEARGARLLEVQVDGAGLPPALIDAMLPAAVRAEPRLAEIARLTEIDLDDDGEISVEGFSADGMRIEIEFPATAPCASTTANLTTAGHCRTRRHGTGWLHLAIPMSPSSNVVGGMSPRWRSTRSETPSKCGWTIRAASRANAFGRTDGGANED